MPGDPIRIGFIPLVDCALLALAQELGCFARQRVDVELHKAQSWGQIRDKLESRELDGAHQLVTMPLQAALAAPGREPPIGYAFTLSRNGNGIILANALWNAGVRDGAGLGRWMAENPGRTPRFGVVHSRGTQEYFLRSWLARGGVFPGDRLALAVIPPQEMVGRLRKGEIDGFCSGEPWTRRAAASKLGRLVAQSRSLLPGLGEKVLGVRTQWHRSHALEHSRIIRALHEAALWMREPANAAAAVEIIASKRYVNTARAVVADALAESLPPGEGGPSDWLVAHGHEPSRADAEWYLDQMAQWGHAGSGSLAGVDFSTLCLEGFHRSSLQASPHLAGQPPGVRPASGGSAGLAASAVDRAALRG